MKNRNPPTASQPREIGLYDPENTGRIGEVVCLRANVDAGGGHHGRLVRVALDPEALGVLADGASRERIDGLLRMFDESRTTVLPPKTLATVEEFDVTPAGRSCARLKAGLLAGRGLSAWCLMRPSGDSLPSANPPINAGLMNDEADLRALRARHPRFYARASSQESEILDQLFILRGSLEVLVLVLRDDFEPQDRAVQERHAHEAERVFVELRNQVEASPAFRSLSSDEKAVIRRDVCQVDFDKDPFK